MSSKANECLNEVKAAITLAEKEAGRASGSVCLIAVSKTFAVEDIRPVLEAGQRVFGENKVQEAMKKWAELRSDYTDVELHLIGPLQSNKAKEAIATFDVIHSVDREKIARSLKSEMDKQGKQVRLYIQVNTGEEEQKAGIAPQDTDAFIQLCRDELGLSIEGLMCIPPVNEAPGMHFALLEKIAKRNGVEKLSMGMSADYPIAIQHGASHVRVGSAIFGARDYS
ncbi:YggS family pyridoxal phosphate-dependent enzyme [Polycladidibacter stylochi]|uniref:YggS family pyridoxal phosphate-dependent enzyme n=1 Tax=Polycladidibacter stylochi TaxID=1807766 RepID=UPI00082F3338|nr:YggS family pyridoxal phosphate-dependent enzyme [Pseudovibrio stylochi]